MGLETLIVILVILILGIFADGVRRMLKERSNRLHLRIDPKAKAQSKQPLDDSNPELPSGGARSARNGEPSSRRQPGLGNIDSLQESPPLVMEREPAPQVPVSKAVQVDLFDSEQAEQDAMSRSAPKSKSKPEPSVTAAEQAKADVIEVIVMHMVTSADKVMPGRELLRALLEKGMRYGDMNIFHLHQPRIGADELQFSMANALEPGTFDIDAMESQDFRAVTFFLKMPGPSNPADALERMIKIVRHLGEYFGGEVRDDQHSVLTQQTIEHMRERVQEFERRQRVAGV